MTVHYFNPHARKQINMEIDKNTPHQKAKLLVSQIDTLLGLREKMNLSHATLSYISRDKIALLNAFIDDPASLIDRRIKELEERLKGL